MIPAYIVSSTGSFAAKQRHLSTSRTQELQCSGASICHCACFPACTSHDAMIFNHITYSIKVLWFCMCLPLCCFLCDDFVLKFLGSEPALPFSHFAFLAGNGQDVAM